MDQTTTATNPLGYERVGKLLRSYAIPSIISLIINSLYNMVDQIFIGQGVGFLGNGATNIIAPITMIAIAIGSLFGDGLAAFFSLHLGKNEPEKSAKGLGSAIVVSAVLSILLTIVSFILLRPLCNLFGATENCMKVSMIAFSVGIGVASGSQPIIGFNYGAQKYDRVRKTFLLSVKICSLITLISWVIFQCFPLQLIRIFGTESGLYEEFAVRCFHIYLLLTFLNGLQMCASVLFQAIGQPVKAAITSLSKQLIFYVPAMLILSYFFGLTGLLAAGPTADALAFILAGGFSYKVLKDMEKKEKAIQNILCRSADGRIRCIVVLSIYKPLQCCSYEKRPDRLYRVGQTKIMRPTQGKFTAITGTREFFKLGKHCFHNLILGIHNIKRTHEFQVFPRNSIMKVLQKEYQGSFVLCYQSS